jgi:hypothetical protein
MSANIRELSIAFGFRKQADIATANLLAGIWKLKKINAEILNPEFVTEDDSNEIGNANEFPSAVYPSHVNVTGRMEKYASAEMVAWNSAFCLGGVTPTGTTPAFIYTCVPIVPVTGGIELPYFSYLEAMRQGGSDIFDRMYPGCVVNDFLVSIATAPGRQSSKITTNFIGCGEIIDPSGITHPAATVEEELPGSSAAITIIGVDYVATPHNIVSLEWGFNNNVNAENGFYPGSGFCAAAPTYAKRGRMEYGTRQALLRFVARYENGSAEYTKLLAGTTGTAVVTQTFDAAGTYTATFQKVAFKGIVLNETGGVVTVAVDCSPMWHVSNGLLTVVAKCNTELICSAP